MPGILSTPFIIQLNGYFAIVTARVAEKRGIQNKPSRQPIPELKKRYYALLESKYKNFNKGRNWLTVFKGRIALLISGNRSIPGRC